MACGEVASAAQVSARSKKCTCGRIAADCSIWNFIADPCLVPRRWTHETLNARLLAQVCDTHAGIIDSSKTARGNAMIPFRQTSGLDFHLLHLVRDPRAVCWALLEKARRTESGRNGLVLSLQTTFGWLYANLACELFRSKHPEQYRRVRYEDLAANPRSVTMSALKAVLPRATWDSRTLGSQDNRHQLYGNRMRRKPLDIDTIRIYDEWQTQMPHRLRRVVEVMTWPMRRRYGY